VDRLETPKWQLMCWTKMLPGDFGTKVKNLSTISGRKIDPRGRVLNVTEN
jgi:hypothetical protein